MYLGPVSEHYISGKEGFTSTRPTTQTIMQEACKRLHAELIIFGNRGSVSMKRWLVGHNHNNHRVLDSVSAENVRPDRVYDGIAASLDGPTTR